MTIMALKTSLSLFAIFQTLDDDIPLALCRKFGEFSRVELTRRVFGEYSSRVCREFSHSLEFFGAMQTRPKTFCIAYMVHA